MSLRLKFCISASRLMSSPGTYPVRSNLRAHEMGPDLQQQQHTYLSRRICTLSWRGGKGRLVFYNMKYRMSLQLMCCISLFRLMFLQGMYPVRSAGCTRWAPTYSNSSTCTCHAVHLRSHGGEGKEIGILHDEVWNVLAAKVLYFGIQVDVLAGHVPCTV